MSDEARWLKRLERAQQRIDVLEALIEDRTRELYLANEALQKHAANLEHAVVERTTELRVALAEAEALSTAKTDFLARMSHELRTPLHGVLGMLEVLARTPLSEKQLRCVTTAGISGRHLLRVIGDILDFSKLQTGRFSIESVPLDLVALLEEVVDASRPLAIQQRLFLGLSLPAQQPPPVLGDPVRIRQILMNLVGNALKFTERGRIDVILEVEGGTDGPVPVRIVVRDTGVGIAAEAKARLFQAFVQADATTSRRFGGTGLGLAISRELADRMGGHIEVESEIGRGSTFILSLELPLSDAAPSVSDLTAEVPRGARVLVVDDQEINRDIAATLLETLGAAPTLAEGGAEAIRLALSEPFDVILLDCHMPGMDGYEVAEVLRRESVACPILAVTADVSVENRSRCLQVGMDDLLGKPYTVQRLAEAVSRYVAVKAPPAPSSPSPGPRGPAVDRVALLEAVGGNEALADRLVAKLLARLPTLLSIVDGAARDRQMDGLRKAAHALKGASAAVYARGVQQAAARVEEEATRGRIEGIEVLRAEVARVEAEQSGRRVA